MIESQLREANRLGVLLREPLPTPQQWARIAADLWCEPEAGRAFRLRQFNVSIVVSRAPITNFPAYWGFAEGKNYAGAGRPPIIWADRAYPPDGSITGTSPALHECGHGVEMAITLAAPVIPMRSIPLWQRSDYAAVHKIMLPRRGIFRQENDYPWEYWGEEYGLFWLWDAGRTDGGAIARFGEPEYLPARKYYYDVLTSAGYTGFRRTP